LKKWRLGCIILSRGLNDLFPGSLCQSTVETSIIRTYSYCPSPLVHLSLSLKERSIGASRGRERVGETLCERRTVGNSRPFSRGARKRRQWIRGRSIANPNPRWSHILHSLPLSLLGQQTLSSAFLALSLSLYPRVVVGASPTLFRLPSLFLSFSLPHLHLFRYFSLSPASENAAARLWNHRSLAYARVVTFYRATETR